MGTAEALNTYEEIYYNLWEIAQRYSSFTTFRIIGNSHDQRMIPMLEIGRGQFCIFCISGIQGQDTGASKYLSRLAKEYAQAYEFGWLLEEFYDMRKLLDEIRICLIPILNPDGCEVFQRGYASIQNPIYRQMLRMQNRPKEEFLGNARGVVLNENFPTEYFRRRQYRDQPGSENETRALIRIMQEYESRGLLIFGTDNPQIQWFPEKHCHSSFRKTHRLARHLQKCSGYPLMKYEIAGNKNRQEQISTGSAEQYYTELTKQAAFTILMKLPEKEEGEKAYEELRILPAEYIFSLTS